MQILIVGIPRERWCCRAHLSTPAEKARIESALQEADRTFWTIQTEAELYLANAYTGLGSVTLLKGQGKDALRWIDKALELVPKQLYALHDRQEVLRYSTSPGHEASSGTNA